MNIAIKTNISKTLFNLLNWYKGCQVSVVHLYIWHFFQPPQGKQSCFISVLTHFPLVSLSGDWDSGLRFRRQWDNCGLCHRLSPPPWKAFAERSTNTFKCFPYAKCYKAIYEMTFPSLPQLLRGHNTPEFIFLFSWMSLWPKWINYPNHWDID